MTDRQKPKPKPSYISLQLRADAARLLLPADHHLIAAGARPEDLPRIEVEPEDKLHITLAFLGRAVDPAPVARACRAVAMSWGPTVVTALVGGVGTFLVPPGLSRERQRQVVWRAVGSPSLHALRAALLSALDEERVPVDRGLERGAWVPHVTLLRAPATLNLGTLTMQPHAGAAQTGLPLDFTALRCRDVDGTITSHPFGGPDGVYPFGTAVEVAP